MAEIDWRPLIIALTMAIFMLIWIVGCTIITDTPDRRESTTYPRVTLTAGRLTLAVLPTDSAPLSPDVLHRTREVDAARGSSPPRGDPAIAPSLTISEPQMVISPTLTMWMPPPLCAETAVGAIQCLGRVDNLHAQSIGEIVLTAHLNRTNGGAITEPITLDQAVIPPNSFAPYRVTFDAAWRDYAGVSVILDRASAQTRRPFVPPQLDDQLLLRVMDDRTSASGEHYLVTATIRNAETLVMRLERAVITLLDDSDRVRGYRVITFDDALLRGGDTLPLRAEISVALDMDQTRLGDAIHHFVYVEARTSP